MNFSKNLKSLREDKNLSQEDLAKLLNYHKLTISKYERGLQEPSFKILEQLTAILECSYDDLLK